MINKISKNKLRKKRHGRIRNHLRGTEARPRLNVFRSSTHIYAQIIDDNKGVTLVSASSIENDANANNGGKIEVAKIVGKLVAERAVAKGIKTIVFDRGGYLYHGRVKALAESAREAGLEF